MLLYVIRFILSMLMALVFRPLFEVILRLAVGMARERAPLSPGFGFSKLRVLWLIGFSIAVSFAVAICLWVGFSSTLAIIGLVLSIGIVAQAVANIDYRMLTSVTSHSSSFATILSSYATLSSRLATPAFARLAVRVRELPAIKIGGAAYASQLVVATFSAAAMAIASLLVDTKSAFAGDAGLAASSSSSYGLFAVSGVVVLALAAVAKFVYARRQ